MTCFTAIFTARDLKNTGISFLVMRFELCVGYENDYTSFQMTIEKIHYQCLKRRYSEKCANHIKTQLQENEEYEKIENCIKVQIFWNTLPRGDLNGHKIRGIKKIYCRKWY